MPCFSDAPYVFDLGGRILFQLLQIVEFLLHLLLFSITPSSRALLSWLRSRVLPAFFPDFTRRELFPAAVFRSHASFSATDVKVVQPAASPWHAAAPRGMCKCFACTCVCSKPERQTLLVKSTNVRGDPGSDVSLGSPRGKSTPHVSALGLSSLDPPVGCLFPCFSGSSGFSSFGHAGSVHRCCLHRCVCHLH